MVGASSEGEAETKERIFKKRESILKNLKLDDTILYS